MIFVKKLDCSEERYDQAKLRRSLANSGADEDTINIIMSKVGKILYNGIPTRELFRFFFNEFKKLQPHIADRYDLKNAILRLGREGFPFESFVSEIFKRKDYLVKLNQIANGKYITHEIDISAKKGNESLMIECKHHAKPWLGTDIQTALYVYARFLDVKNSFNSSMLVTNTKFSKQVIDYANGVGLKLMGWKYPKEDSLEYNIERFRLYPVTMLCSLSRNKVELLLKDRIILVKTLQTKNVAELCKTLRITKDKAQKILEETKVLCVDNR